MPTVSWHPVVANVFEVVNKYGGVPNINECFCFDAHLQHTMASGDHLLNNDIFQLEEEVVTIPGNDKELNTDDVKVYLHEYSLGEQGIFSYNDELDDDSETQDDESQSGSEDSESIRPASVGETRQSDPQSQVAPIVLSLGDLDNVAQQLPLNGVPGYQQNIRLL